MKPPIIVTGCPRSGSRIIAGILDICGGNGGQSMDQKRFASMRMQHLITEYMHWQDINDQYPLRPTIDLSVPVDWRNKVEAVAEKDGIQPGDTWFIRSPEALLMWPVWHTAFPDAQWVIVRRKTGDIINSCKKTGHMTAYKDPNVRKAAGVKDEADGWKKWVHEYEARMVETMMAGLDCKVIWPQRMAFGDFQQVHSLLQWTGLRWNSDVLGFVDKKLEKTRLKETEL